MLAEFAAVYHFTNHFIAAHGRNAQLDESISEKNASAALNFFWERAKRGGNSGHVAGAISAGNCETLAGLKRDAKAANKCSGANFWPAEIGQNCERLFHRGRGFTK